MRISDWSSDVCSSDLARGEGLEMPAPTDLAGLLRDVVAQMTRDGRTVDLHVEQDLMLPLRREAMRRCLTNLLANAQRHAKHVAVRAGRRKSLVEVTIDDDGPGIPPERYEDVFKPFFRLDQSRNPATGGIGLGLTIPRDVARSHGGDRSEERRVGTEWVSKCRSRRSPEN